MGEFGIVKIQDPSGKENIQDQNIPEEDRISTSGSSSSATIEVSESGCILEQVAFSLKNFGFLKENAPARSIFLNLHGISKC